MEDSFRVRVDRVFGSLVSYSPSNNSNSNNNTPPPSSSSLTSLWSLSDQEFERKEWRRDPPDYPPHSLSPPSNLLHHPLPSSSSSSSSPTTAALSLPPPHRQHLYSDRDDHHHQHDAKNNEEKVDNQADKDHQDDEEEQDWDIRSSIGLDCTLDFEDEEDEYDKVAVGRETAGDILCMGDVVDYGIEVNAHNELPSSFKDAPRDPRANHMAAKLRLREDAEAAGDFDTSKFSEMYMSSVTNGQSQQKVEDLITPKPILKKREKPMHNKSPKRVRFHEQRPLGPNDSALGTCSAEEISSLEEALDLPGNQSLLLEAKASDVESSVPLKSSSSRESALPEDAPSVPRVSTYVPDYLRNPTRYTRYDLALSYDMDEESNRKACTEFLNQVKKVNPAETHLDEASLTFQHPLTFTPKKKEHDLSMVKENGIKQNQGEVSKDNHITVGIAAGDAYAQDSEVCAMEEDGFETVVCKTSQKPGRRYRSRTRTDMDSDDHVT